LQTNEKATNGNQGRRILVVDDEPAVCNAIKMMLEFDGHQVRTASGGMDALSLIEQDRFDVVITDYAMPKMKGDALAAAIKQRLPNQPVVMISAHEAMLRSSDNPLPGVDLLLGKPFLLEDLRNGIAKVLQQGQGS
jgi:two-component system response regulator MprA